MTTLTLKSSNFKDGQRLPKEYTCEGANVSPQLSWSPVPTGTQSFVLICEDLDAPGKTWSHWVVFNIPPSITSLNRGVPTDKILDSGALQGLNSFGNIGYGGACPPPTHGDHHYFFKVYALDKALDLQAGVSKHDVEKAMTGHILAQGELMGTYSR